MKRLSRIYEYGPRSDQFDVCANCGKIRAAHRIGDDRCPRISKKGYNVSFDHTTTTFKKEMSTKKDDDSKPRCVIENDKVPTDWYDGQEGHTVKEWGQREYDSGRKTGRMEGQMMAFTYLIERATEMFKQGRDADAMQLRSHANAIKDLPLQ